MALGAGMVLAALSGSKGPGLLVWVPPTWYGFAWVGHYFYQADIPAVFTYGNGAIMYIHIHTYIHIPCPGALSFCCSPLPL